LYDTHPMVRPLHQANVFDGRCPSQEVLDLVANKWAVLVIHCLGRETKRYRDLTREIGGVSQKMLTHTLRGLERNGLVTRKVYPVVPPHVEYALTPLGRTLLAPLKSLCEWAQRHMDEVHAARGRLRPERKASVRA
jgi:DNA-binding HxlR family transcriptional regulator